MMVKMFESTKDMILTSDEFGDIMRCKFCGHNYFVSKRSQCPHCHCDNALYFMEINVSRNDFLLFEKKEGMKFVLSEQVIDICGKKFYRIQYTKGISLANQQIYRGDFGGFVTQDTDLSHYDNACILDNACASHISIYEKAIICGNAYVSGDILVSGHAVIKDNSYVTATEHSEISGRTIISDSAFIRGSFDFCDKTRIQGNASIDIPENSIPIRCRGNTKIRGTYRLTRENAERNKIKDESYPKSLFHDSLFYNSILE